jgi:uracil-DNA glycosylase family 4
MFVGEAPRHGGSRTEGVFSARICQLVDRLNIGRVYVTDAVKCPAPERPYHTRREPTIHQLDACQRWLADEIASVGPKMIVPLGATAAWAVVHALGGEQKEARTLAGFERQFGPRAVLKGIYVSPLSHPSRIASNDWDTWLAGAVDCLAAVKLNPCIGRSTA